MLASEVAVLKSRDDISVKCSRYQDTGPTDPSLELEQVYFTVCDTDQWVSPVICGWGFK